MSIDLNKSIVSLLVIWPPKKGVVIIVIMDMNDRGIHALVWSYKINDTLMNFFINESCMDQVVGPFIECSRPILAYVGGLVEA